MPKPIKFLFWCVVAILIACAIALFLYLVIEATINNTCMSIEWDAFKIIFLEWWHSIMR